MSKKLCLWSGGRVKVYNTKNVKDKECQKTLLLLFTIYTVGRKKDSTFILVITVKENIAVL